MALTINDSWLKQNRLKMGIVSAFIIVGFVYFTLNSGPSSESFEPRVYFAQVIQVGGVGSDIYTNRAYYIGDGTANQEGWPIYLDKDSYAPVSLNTPFNLIYLLCKEGYGANVVQSGTSDKDPFVVGVDKQGNSMGFGIEVKEQIKNELVIRCQKH